MSLLYDKVTEKLEKLFRRDIEGEFLQHMGNKFLEQNGGAKMSEAFRFIKSLERHGKLTVCTTAVTRLQDPKRITDDNKRNINYLLRYCFVIAYCCDVSVPELNLIYEAMLRKVMDPCALTKTMKNLAQLVIPDESKIIISHSFDAIVKGPAACTYWAERKYKPNPEYLIVDLKYFLFCEILQIQLFRKKSTLDVKNWFDRVHTLPFPYQTIENAMEALKIISSAAMYIPVSCDAKGVLNCYAQFITDCLIKYDKFNTNDTAEVISLNMTVLLFDLFGLEVFPYLINALASEHQEVFFTNACENICDSLIRSGTTHSTFTVTFGILVVDLRKKIGDNPNFLPFSQALLLAIVRRSINLSKSGVSPTLGWLALQQLIVSFEKLYPVLQPELHAAIVKRIVPLVSDENTYKNIPVDLCLQLIQQLPASFADMRLLILNVFSNIGRELFYANFRSMANPEESLLHCPHLLDVFAANFATIDATEPGEVVHTGGYYANRFREYFDPINFLLTGVADGTSAEMNRKRTIFQAQRDIIVDSFSVAFCSVLRLILLSQNYYKLGSSSNSPVSSDSSASDSNATADEYTLMHVEDEVFKLLQIKPFNSVILDSRKALQSKCFQNFAMLERSHIVSNKVPNVPIFYSDVASAYGKVLFAVELRSNQGALNSSERELSSRVLTSCMEYLPVQNRMYMCETTFSFVRAGFEWFKLYLTRNPFEPPKNILDLPDSLVPLLEQHQQRAEISDKMKLFFQYFCSDTKKKIAAAIELIKTQSVTRANIAFFSQNECEELKRLYSAHNKFLRPCFDGALAPSKASFSFLVAVWVRALTRPQGVTAVEL